MAIEEHTLIHRPYLTKIHFIGDLWDDGSQNLEHFPAFENKTIHEQCPSINRFVHSAHLALRKSFCSELVINTKKQCDAVKRTGPNQIPSHLFFDCKDPVPDVPLELLCDNKGQIGRSHNLGVY